MSSINDSYNVTGKVGMISAFMHYGSPKFVSLSDDDNTQGYIVVDEESVTEERHMKNLIVNSAGILVARRMVPSSGGTGGVTGLSNGITHLEVGTGVGTGSQASPQTEPATQTGIRQTIASNNGRKAISSWTYLTNVGVVTATPTNIIQYTTTFTETEAVGALVEMGLFGGNATSTANSGVMFNYKVFPVWNKGNTVQLTVKWNITF